MKTALNESVFPYSDELTAVATANAIRSARLTARDLLETAELLFSLKRFQHSAALSTLSIEEAAKISILIMIFLNIGGDKNRLWRNYRSHKAKTSWLNVAIEGRMRATMSHLGRAAAKDVAQMGPTPEELETAKQRAMYSDCLLVSDVFVAHYPGEIDWRTDAWHRLCEAQAMVSALRDYPPDELAVWQKHLGRGRAEESSSTALQQLRNELVIGGFIEENWWETLLQDADQESQQLPE